jgi:CheY-like chemotaxis protein
MTMDFLVDEAENGLIAIELFQENKLLSKQDKSLPYDVIILDLDMPIMNGYEAC